MAKLSDIFNRRNENGADKTVIPLPAMPLKGNGRTEPGPASPTELGSRIGEEHETLRNLLTDAARRIEDLDELKQAFHRLVTPFTATLRALETETSLTLSLSARLDEQRAAYDAVCDEFYALEKKATQLGAETERLRADLELARENGRAVDSARTELAEALEARNAHLAEVERQLEQETAQRRSLSDTHRGQQQQLDAAEKHIVALEGELAAARERLMLTTNEKGSLQNALDQALTESARISRSLADSESTLTAMRAQFARLEASYAEACGERGRLAAALDEAKEQHQAERNTLTTRLDGLQSRAATAERLLAETRASLLARTEEVRAFDRKAVDATIARGAAERRLTQLGSIHEARERQIRDLDTARAALAERTNDLTKSLKAREMALARAEETIASLTARNGQLEADIQVARVGVERRVEELTSALERERLERAVVEGALEAARGDNVRLRSEVAGLRLSVRRGVVADDAPMAPAGPAADDTAAAEARTKASAAANGHKA